MVDLAALGIVTSTYSAGLPRVGKEDGRIAIKVSCIDIALHAALLFPGFTIARKSIVCYSFGLLMYTSAAMLGCTSEQLERKASVCFLHICMNSGLSVD